MPEFPVRRSLPATGSEAKGSTEQRNHDDPRHRNGIRQVHVVRTTRSGLWWCGSIIAPGASGSGPGTSTSALPWSEEQMGRGHVARRRYGQRMRPCMVGSTKNDGGKVHDLPAVFARIATAGVLRVDAALFDGKGYTVDGQHVGGNAVVHVVSLRVAHYVFKLRADASSCSFTTASFQKYPWRSCTHSK